MWNQTDPRAVVNQRAQIVVSDGKFASYAVVETHNGHYVAIHELIAGHTFVDEKDQWPKKLQWAYLPKTEIKNDVAD